MKLKTKDIIVFALLGALMYAAKLVMEPLPNVHLIGMFIVSITLVYRAKALFPIYLFVLLSGLFGGFGLWWLPYLYIWTLLWGAAMLIPRRLSFKMQCCIGIMLSGAHGFLYGVLFAPAQALLFGLDFNEMLAWIAAGLPFDIVHGISNLCCGLLIPAVATVLKNAKK